MQTLKKFSYAIISMIILIGIAHAYVPTAGQISDKVTGMSYWLGRFFMACSIAIGLGFMFSGALKVKYHRENPSAIPLTTAVFQIIFGVIMLLLAGFFSLTSPYVFGKHGGQLDVLRPLMPKDAAPASDTD